MNTQLLRYNVLTEHLTFPPIPPATRDFGRTGRTHPLQPTPLRGLLAAAPRAFRWFAIKGDFHAHAARLNVTVGRRRQI